MDSAAGVRRSLWRRAATHLHKESFMTWSNLLLFNPLRRRACRWGRGRIRRLVCCRAERSVGLEFDGAPNLPRLFGAEFSVHG